MYLPLPLSTGEAIEAIAAGAPAAAALPSGHFAVLSYQEPGSESWRGHLHAFIQAFEQEEAVHLFILAPGRLEGHLRAHMAHELAEERWADRVHVVVGQGGDEALALLMGTCHAYLDDVAAAPAHLARLLGLQVVSSADADTLRAALEAFRSGRSPRVSHPVAVHVLDQLRRQRGQARVLATGEADALWQLKDVVPAASHEPLDAVVALAGLPEAPEAIAARLNPGGVLVVEGDLDPRPFVALGFEVRRERPWVLRKPVAAEASGIARVMLLHKEHFCTTAKYFARALRQLGLEVLVAGPGQGALGGLETAHDVDVPAAIEALPESLRPDLVFYVDVNMEPQFRPRGLDRVEAPTVGYFIDSHLNLADHLGRAGQFDHVGVAHGQYVPAFTQRGIPAFHLPCSADPDVFRPMAVPRDREIVFIGNTGVHPWRVELLEGLNGRFDVYQDRAFFERCAEAFGHGQIAFNCSLNGDLNMRVFETMAAGSLLVTDRLAPESGLESFFTDREHLVLYETAEQLHAAVSHYLASPEEAERIRRQAREAILAGHTYRHRALAVLERALMQPSRGLSLLTGIRRFAQGDLAGAIEAFAQATQGDRISPEALNNLGVCLVAAGRPGEAREMFAGALRLAPDYQAARENLAALDGNATVSGPLDEPAPLAAPVPAELRTWVPQSALRVLHVACGAGELGAELKRERPGIEVVGLEDDRHAALHAARVLDAVVQGPSDDLRAFPYPPGYFDCVVVAHELEAAKRPEAVLEAVLPFVREGGTLVVSARNVRHVDRLKALLVDGRPVGPAMTYDQLEGLQQQFGLALERMEGLRGTLDKSTFDLLGEAARILGGDKATYRQEARVAEFLLRWRKPTADEPGMQAVVPRAAVRPEEPAVASIVILTLNQWDYTQQCLESVFTYSTVPFEVIIVDNGSTDGTRDHLRALASKEPRLRVVFNEANMGFAHGCNQGIAMAEGDVVVLLNNDTVVTEGWLEGLIRPMQENPRIGAVGPISNNVAGVQERSFVPYGTDLARMHAFARWHAQAHRGEGEILMRAIGFCLAVRRSVLEIIGGFDTRYAIGNMEDDDLCLRIHTTGHRVFIARDVFIHHVGRVTFTGEKMDYAGHMEKNWLTFARKWGLPEDPNAGGYRSRDVEHHTFNPVRDMFPILVPEAPPAPITAPRGYHFLARFDARRPESLIEAIRAYNAAFTAQDDVALLIWLDPAGPVGLEAAAETLGALLADAGLDGEDTPELVLFDAPTNPMVVSRGYRAAQACLPLGDATVEEAARTCGLAIVSPTPEALRAATHHERPTSQV